jgi:hypothetical protein
MSTQLEDLKEIESYLTGEMPEEKRSAFEAKVKNELGINEDVALTGRLIDAVKGYGFKQMIKRIRAEEFGEAGSGQIPL